MSLWTGTEARQATGGALRGSWSASGVSIDSRTIAEGELFAALADRRDGHQFAAAALDAGAAAAMVSRIPAGLPPGAPLLVVPSVPAALRGLAAWRRRRTGGKIIAVTGSVGKTSAKEMLRVILSSQGKTHAAAHSFNNHWGVPLTLANMPADADFAVVEIGMNRPGEIAPLSRLARPHVGLITEIAPAHLAAFGTLDGIAAEKASLFSGLENGGSAVVNSGSPGIRVIEARAAAAGAEIVRFGSNADDQYRLKEMRAVANGTVVKVKRRAGCHWVMLNSFGAHFARNALGAIAAAEAAGADPDVATLDLRQWKPPSGRGDVTEIQLHPDRPPLRLIDDAFNANPSSVAAAFEALAARRAAAPEQGGRVVAVLGDMLELGRGERGMHEAIAGLASLEHFTQIHCAGPLMRSLHNRLQTDKRGEWRPSAEEIAAVVGRLVAPGDTVLVKGSKGSRISIVADAIRRMGGARGRAQPGEG